MKTRIEDLKVGDGFIYEGNFFTITEVIIGKGMDLETEGGNRWSYNFLNKKDVKCYTPEEYPERFL